MVGRALSGRLKLATAAVVAIIAWGNVESGMALTKKTHPDNRRRDERVCAELEVEIHHDEGGVLATGRCCNISPGGMFIVTDRGVAEGTKCRVRVHRHAPPILSPMCLWGRVTRNDADGLGVTFDGSDRQLASFVAELFATALDPRVA